MKSGSRVVHGWKCRKRDSATLTGVILDDGQTIILLRKMMCHSLMADVCESGGQTISTLQQVWIPFNDRQQWRVSGSMSDGRQGRDGHTIDPVSTDILCLDDFYTEDLIPRNIKYDLILKSH